MHRRSSALVVVVIALFAMLAAADYTCTEGTRLQNTHLEKIDGKTIDECKQICDAFGDYCDAVSMQDGTSTCYVFGSAKYSFTSETATGWTSCEKK